ncbi:MULTISPECIES: sodium:solute symporter family protein [Olivibacter]|jgi:SSS family transporter|uniref:Sodium:solute symporter family protein n=1 Tax=Olivibacter oleidegradans TaxID=760123 RepID=A0ABV6HJI2_9SPHI|nr:MULTISPECIES: sodium:solute symporter family protein [Olivibacter]QEL04304.1 Na+:solute symporter [Olivibacter sp. LS-1]
MNNIDYVVMAVFALLILCIGMVFTYSGSKNTSTFFEAGGQTPWWINGLSLFISYFSAGTFVVWGSIAYQGGFVANGIQLTMMLGGLITAIFIAHRWKKTGALTAAEYIGVRFGVKTQQFYTTLTLLYSLFSVAAVLYPVGKMVNVASGISIEASVLIIGGIIILYTAAGGLWAVLVTDVVQFVVLSAAVLIVIPLALKDAGGIQTFASNAPDHFFDFFNSEYSIGFFFAFLLYQTIYIGGNWPYVQRYTSVSNEKNARKVAFLFTGLYLICPFIWMLPPMLYRVINPNLQGIEAEGAYMMMAQKVLPAGLVGLVLSGMISATASKANTTLNLVAVVFANDVYKKIFFPKASDKTLVWVARVFTVLFGLLTMVIAILIPKVGGIVEMVLSTAAIAGGSLFAPLIWSLFSKKQTAKSIVFASIVSLVVSIWMKIGAPFIMGIRLDRFLETCLGVGLPLAILALFELINRKQHYAAFSKKEESIHEYNERQDSVKQNIFGIKVIAFSITLVGFGIALLGIGADDGLVAVIVGAGIMLGGGAIWKSILSAQ